MVMTLPLAQLLSLTSGFGSDGGDDDVAAFCCCGSTGAGEAPVVVWEGIGAGGLGVAAGGGGTAALGGGGGGGDFATGAGVGWVSFGGLSASL